AESKTYREKIWDWFNDDLYTRLEPNAAIILIQTRWHEDDLSGRLIKQMQHDGGEHWDVISLPALSEGSEKRSEDTPVLMSAKHEDHKHEGHLAASGDGDMSVPAPSSDPLNRQPDEPLCPERFTREDLYRIKRQLGTY